MFFPFFLFLLFRGLFYFFRNPKCDFLIINFDNQNYKLHYAKEKDAPKIVPKNSFFWRKLQLSMRNEPILEGIGFRETIIKSAFRQIPEENTRHIFLPKSKFSLQKNQILRAVDKKDINGWIETKCIILDYGYGSGFGFWKGLFFIENGLLYAVPIAMDFEDFDSVVGEFRLFSSINVGEEERIKKIIELNKDFLKNNQPFLRTYEDKRKKAFPLLLKSEAR